MDVILILEDDTKLNDGIKLALKKEDCCFIQCRTIQAAREKLGNEKVDLMLLDINLPDGNGLDFLVEIRQTSSMPVILITANNMEADIVTGLELGANDYITKPFSLMVLRARAGVWLRKGTEKAIGRVTIGQFEFDFERMVFKSKGQVVELSKTEQRLLRILVENRGATISRSRLIDYVWAGDTEFVDEHALTVAVKRLRDKLGDPTGSGAAIRTVYGIGYTWVVA